MEKVRYMISDAANIVNVESHVLRYWEDELELNIPRNEMGHRYYTKENIQEFQKIKELKEQGYQLKAIRMIVHNGTIENPEEVPAKEANLHQIPMASAALPVPEAVDTKTAPAKVKETTQENIMDNTDKMAQFTDLMTQIVGKALAANNQALSKNISENVGEQVVKEMNYLMREREEAEEERFRKLDSAIRGNMKRKESKKIRFGKKRVVGEPESV